MAVVKNPADDQEVFDYVVNALRKQGKKSAIYQDQCLYRGPNGTKCAAGHLIPDEDYQSSWEGYSIQDTTISLAGKYIKSQGYNLTLVMALQNAHDGRLERWEQSFEQIASDFVLKYMPPNKE